MAARWPDDNEGLNRNFSNQIKRKQSFTRMHSPRSVITPSENMAAQMDKRQDEIPASCYVICKGDLCFHPLNSSLKVDAK